jgi:endonuclease/exonuclease/phosphatase family metal-dependent hydrolase
MRLIYILPLALLLITAVCVSRAEPSGTARVGPGLELSLASLNIRYGTADDGPDAWPHRRDMVTGLLARLDADVIGLQEALRFQLDELAADLPGYAEIGVGRDDGATRGEYAAILVRTERFTIDEAGTFWLSDTPQTVASTHWGNRITRVCTWARLIDKATGRGFYVFNAHLDHQSQPSRERSAELIAAKAAGRAHADEPVVLMGDFNAGEDNPALRYLRGEVDRASDPEAWPGHAPPAPPRLVDPFRVLHPDATEVGTFSGFAPGATTGEKIDHILVSPGAEALGATIDRESRDGRYPSDHFAVTARVRFGGG